MKSPRTSSVLSSLPDAPSSAFDVVEWSIDVSVAFNSPAGTYFQADIRREDELLGRIGMTGPSPNRSHAEEALAEQCRRWIIEYARREPATALHGEATI